jgi:hypothetical protein
MTSNPGPKWAGMTEIKKSFACGEKTSSAKASLRV